MKVVLFCGGLGMRLRDYSEKVPKPMVPIGNRPIIWHLMKYYAHFGHNEFILCLGYRADTIKHYFLNYNECLSNDFTLTKGGRDIELMNRDIADWKITFVDTGIEANIATRLTKVRRYLGDDEFFLANYADGLSDLPMDDFADRAVERGKIATFLSVKPTTYFHIVDSDEDGVVKKIDELNHAPVWMNGGFFVFNQRIFDFIERGEELVIEPFQRLIDQGELVTEKYGGFWRSMDTFKDKQLLEDIYASAGAPWAVWRNGDDRAS